MMKYPRSIFLGSVFTTLFAAFPVTAKDTFSKQEQLLAHPEVRGAIAAIDAYVQGVQTYDKVPGISVGLVYDQDLLWQNGYGYSNLETKRPADADTLYSICSISKLFF